MKVLAALRRPTLVRRMMGTLLVAFVLVWLVLLTRDLLTATDRRAHDARVQTLGEHLLSIITPLEHAAEARAAVAASAALINLSYRKEQVPGAVLIELRDASGVRLFWSAEGGAAVLHGSAGQISGAVANGLPYRLYVGRGGHWSLLVAAPVLPTGWLIGALGGALTVDMLIALPLVLLPLWLAVTRALAPLRKLSGQIAARGPDDLSPIATVPVHAELQPLVHSLDHLLARLRLKLAREQAFIEDAAHELRTPMAVLAAQAHVLAESVDAAQRAEAQRRLAQAIARAAHLVSQLLDLARLDQQGPRPAPSEVDVAELLRGILAAVAPAALARQIGLSLEAPARLMYPLEVAPFESIVQNLLNNALAYVPNHSRVELHLQATSHGLLLRVADDGPGIAQALRALVFERFYRGSDHATPGAGLGLAIVREAALRLGGAVHLSEGIDGHGCTFTLTLARTLSA